MSDPHVIGTEPPTPENDPQGRFRKFKTIGPVTPGLRIEGVYGGDHGGDFGIVTVNGVRLSPAPSLKVRNHIPTGFAWGYSGSGPSQLALAILLKAGVPQDRAVTFYSRFRDQFIAPLKRESFAIKVDVLAWVGEQMAAAHKAGGL